MVKKCSICKIEKEISEFHKWKYGPDGYKRYCKSCRVKETKDYYGRKQNEIKERVKKYRDRNSVQVRKKRMERYYKNKDSEAKYMSEYRTKNRKELTQKDIQRRKTDPIHKLKHTMNSRLRMFLKSKNLSKKNKTFSVIGCTPQELKEHLENKFILGMSWENQGQWHIDHIIPLSSAKTEDEIYKLCHYTNLQPLWAEDNLKKSNKLIINT
jgi:hypothetical protein